MKKKIGLTARKVFLLILVVFWSVNLWAQLKDTTVNVAIAVDPSTINMLEFKTSVDLIPMLHIASALLESDPVTGDYDVTLKGVLSESMTLMDNGKDVKFVLKKGFRFHTGDPVTAHDVRFTYEQCVDPANANIMGGPLDEIEEIEVLDDHTLIFRFYEPYAPWKGLLWIGITSEKYYEKAGREVFRKHPVGSGPFRFVERKIGEYIILETNEDHPDAAEFRRLKLWTVTDEITRLSMLETGELDLVSQVLPHNVKRLERSRLIKVKQESRVPSLYAIAGKPENYAILKDRKFAMAVQMAINRQEIVDKIFLGEGYPLYQWVTRVELGFDPNFRIEFNPKKARELLRQSSYKPGTPIFMTYVAGDAPMADLVAAVIQKYLTNIGLNFRLRKLEYGVRATYARNKDPREGHYTLFNWAGGKDPSVRLKMSLMTDSDYAAYVTRPRQNEINELVVAQGREMDEKKRIVLLKKIQKINDEDATTAELFGLNMIYAMNTRIDYTWTPQMNGFSFLNRIKIVE